MPRVDRPLPPRLDRRALLAAGVGTVSALTLAACGIRLGDNVPHLRHVPRRTPIPGEAFLLALLHSSVTLSRQAAALGGAPAGLPAQLAVLHTSQVTVLEAELLRLGVPQTLVTAAKATTPPTGSAATPADLAVAENAEVASSPFPLLARVSATARPLAGAVLAQRWAAGILLGRPQPVPVPTWKAPALASSFLDSTRAAVYGLEVAAAQSAPGTQWTLARTTLAALQARAQVQEGLAGASAGPPPLGYPLPFPVTSPASARQLAVQVLVGLRATNARDIASAADAAGPLGSAVGWLADTEVLASQWGVRLAAFPGLT